MKQEIEQLESGHKNLRDLIERKRNELRISSKVWIASKTEVTHPHVLFPESGADFWIGQKIERYFETRAKFGSVCFSLQRLSDTEGSVRLSLQLSLTTVEDLREILGYLQRKFGLSKSGTFSLHQSNSSWHGSGVENFLIAVMQWSNRYELSASSSFHHSESISYFDEFEGGWLQLSAQQRVNSSVPSFFHNSELAVLLPGIPVDMAPLKSLCAYTNNPGRHLQMLDQKYSATIRLRKPVVLKVVGNILNRENASLEDSDRQSIVIGVIAQNPYYLKNRLPEELSSIDIMPISDLKEMELIVCALRDWHDLGDTIDRYVLQGFDVLAGGIDFILRPFGTWGNIKIKA